MGNLNLQTLPRPVRGNQYEIELHPDREVWGPNGGYLSPILLRAVGLHANKDVPVSYCGHYLRVPSFGSAQITVDCVKDGKQAAAFQVQLRQSDNLMTQATPPLYVVPSLDLYVQFHRFSPRSHWLLSDAVWDDAGQLLASGGSQSLLRAVASAY